MNELVQRLSQGTHAIQVGGPLPSLADFQERVQEMGYVFIKFTGTNGGTDLGVRVDKTATTILEGSFAEGVGLVHVEGTLTLNYVPVRCVADIHIATLAGEGRLVVQEEVSA